MAEPLPCSWRCETRMLKFVVIALRKKILLGVSGGIAAVDTVRLARELRRHGANVSVMMTHSAQKIISPLAVEWATQTEVITNWESDLSALETVDGILLKQLETF